MATACETAAMGDDRSMPATTPTPPTACFLHGLESSSQGTKARWFEERFPGVLLRDYEGDLDQRMTQLISQLDGRDDLVLIGSSFGGLMATQFALRYPERCRRLVLLAPALNHAGYAPPAEPLDVETVLVTGTQDTVCPPDVIVPLAQATFRRLEVQVEEDDHLLRWTFPQLDWVRLLSR